MVEAILSSSFPQAVVWGPDLITIHNDAFLPILGAKPPAIGRSFADIRSEARPDIAPIAEKALHGEPTFIKNFLGHQSPWPRRGSPLWFHPGVEAVNCKTQSIPQG